MKTILKGINGFVFTAVMAVLLSALFNVNPFAVFAGLIVLSAFVPKKIKGVAFMALEREVWLQDIVDNLWRNNQFAEKAVDHSAFVYNGIIVHMPVAGAASGNTKNETVFPVAVTRRADTELTYTIDTYRTNPTHVLNIENYQLSYDKRQSVLGEDQRSLIQYAMQGLIYTWGPAVAQTFLTEGGAVPANLTGAVGNRKAMTKAAFGKVKLAMDAADIDPNDRWAVLNAYHHQELIDSFTDAEKTGFYAAADMKEGIVGRYLSINVIMRSHVLRYRGAEGAQAKVDEQAGAFGASDKTGDRKASLFWQRDAVAKAVGDIKMFDKTSDPTYYGDIYSFEMALGGRIRRAAGVYAIVDADAA